MTPSTQVLLDALRFYADEKNWTPQPVASCIDEDGGDIARAALNAEQLKVCHHLSIGFGKSECSAATCKWPECSTQELASAIDPPTKLGESAHPPAFDEASNQKAMDAEFMRIWSLSEQMMSSVRAKQSIYNELYQGFSEGWLAARRQENKA